MGDYRKRIWKRICITIDSDSSDDEGPPSKVNKTKNVSHNVHNALEKSVSKNQSAVASRNVKDNDQHHVAKKRKLDLSTPYVIPNTGSISANFYQQVIFNITSLTLQGNISGLLQLSVLTTLSVRRKLIVHCAKSDEYLKYSLKWLLETLESSKQKNIELIKSHTVLPSMLRMSGKSLWASFISITNLMWLDPQSNLFVAAVQNVVRFFQSQVRVLHSAFQKLEKKPVPVCVKRGVEAAYESIINLTFLLNSLFKKKNFMMKDFVLLTIDIAMLPFFSSDAKKLRCLLYLIRSVLKSQSGCLDKCTIKLHLEMCQTEAMNKNIFIPLKSGSQVHKCTLLLLTLIQSSIELPVPQTWVETGTCHLNEILSSKDVKSILGGAMQDTENQFSNLQTKSRKVLQNADFIVRFFYDLVVSSVESVPLENLHQCAEHFKSFLQDLFILMEDFDWPAAEYVLISLSNSMVTSLGEGELPKSSSKFLTECLTSILLKFVHLISSLEVEDLKSLTFLQGALFAHLIRHCRDDHTQDKFLFYLAVWQTDLITEEWGNKARPCNTAQLGESQFVHRDNVRDVVNCITGLRRTADIKSIFHKILLLKNRSDNRFLLRFIMSLVVRVFESNPKLFLEDPLLVKIISSRNKEDLIVLRKDRIRCLIAYLLHRSDQFDSYYEILNSYISDKETRSVRITAVQGMKELGLKFYNNPKVLRKLVLLLRPDGDYTDSAAQYFCKITWLEPVNDTEKRGLLKNKVLMLIDMFALITDTNKVEEMFPLLFRLECNRSGQTYKQQLKACAQMVDELSRLCVEKTLLQGSKMVAGFKLLNFFAKITPRPLILRCVPLLRRFGRLCKTVTPDVVLTSATTKALETVLSCGQRGSPTVLYNFFIDSFKVSNIFNKNTIASGLSSGCVAASLLREHSIIKTYSCLSIANMGVLDTDSHDSPEQNRLVQRQLFIFGVILKHLEDNNDYKFILEIAREVILVEKDNFDEKLIQTAIFFLGSACFLHPKLTLKKSVKEIYSNVLSHEVPTLVLLQVLKNICELLRSLLEYTAKKNFRSTRYLTYPFGSPSSGNMISLDTAKKVAERIAETYFEAAIDRYVHPDVLVRLAVLEFLIVAGQSEVVSCVQFIPPLTVMACDPEKCISSRARKRLAEHIQIHNDCVLSSLETALSLICRFNVTITPISSPIQGYTVDENGLGVTKLSDLNSVLVESTSGNFKMIPFIVKKFDPARETCIFELLYCAGNVAHFVYPKRRDIVSTVRQIESMILSMSNIIENLNKVLHRRKSKLNVHKKRIGNALRLLLLLEIRSFLMKMYRVQKGEVSTLKQERSYKIPIPHKGKIRWVSDRSKGSCIFEEDLTMKFCPTISAEKAIKCDACCGRNFSTETLERLFKQLRKLWKEFHEV